VTLAVLVAGTAEAAVWEGSMLTAWQRLVPFLLAGLLVFNLIEALTIGDRGDWITAALIALLLAYTVWRRGRRSEP
jgi:hypothetical protein